jgi:hypothetical protein
MSCCLLPAVLKWKCSRQRTNGNLFMCNMINLASSAVCIALKFFSVMLQLQPLTPLVDEFASRLFGELDYVQEGLSAEKFQVGGTLFLSC